MLYPQQNAARLTMRLDGVWDFALDHGSPEALSLDPARPLPGAETVAVPASFNDQKPDRAWRDHYGWVFYQRRITLPRACAGQRVVLRFGAVTHQARVWLDGEPIAGHRGGFLPFEVEVTGRLAPGASALLTVAADNRVSHSTLPVGNEPGQIAFFGSDNAGIPSVEHAKASARPQNRPNFDFFNYAGIQRPVTLYTTPAAYIADITLVPHISGRVEYRVETVGDGAVTVEILDPAGRPVAKAEGAAGSVDVPHPQLWEPWPGTPHLYTARVTFGEDCYEETFGIREVRVEGARLLLNGRPLYLKGFGKHEDSPLHGRGLDEAANVTDLHFMHWFGANALRTSHYPYAEEFYALCDREGILVIDETPAVGIGGAEGDPYQTYPLAGHHRQVLADLMTIRERYGSLAGRKLCFVGDGNNMANSLIAGGLMAGMQVTCVCPRTYRPAADVLAFTRPYGDSFELLEDPAAGVKDADVVVTAVWNNAANEAEAERRMREFLGYQLTGSLLENAKPGCMVLHCLPAHRGEEISNAVFEAHAQEIFDEAENRLHVQKAVLAILLAGK